MHKCKGFDLTAQKSMKRLLQTSEGVVTDQIIIFIVHLLLRLTSYQNETNIISFGHRAYICVYRTEMKLISYIINSTSHLHCVSCQQSPVVLVCCGMGYYHPATQFSFPVHLQHPDTGNLFEDLWQQTRCSVI